jgi:outer membrane protein assembly factor BamB
MMKKRHMLLILTLIAGVMRGQASLPDALENLDAPGGLIVYIGASDVARAAALNHDGRFLVHVLYTDSGAAEKASAAVVAQDLSGRATVSVFDGEKLPFVDNCVNLLVVSSGKWQVAREEIARVLTPRGVSVFLDATRATRDTCRKPVPPSIDDWTHNLYDAGNSGVSRDLKAGSPRHMQWTADPRFSRSHDGNSSILSMVSAGGRVFYMMDEGSTAFLSLPSKWNLVARDAFNGKLLWRKPLPQTLLMQVGNIKSGFANLGHRMVAHEDIVYATLGFNAPITALDSRTGGELWTSDATTGAEELILFDGVLFCLVNLSDASRVKHPFQAMEDIKRVPATDIPRKLVALDAKTGKLLWEKKPGMALPLSLTAGDAGAFIHDGTSIVAMDTKSGKERWRSERITYYAQLQQYSGVNMVLVDDVMLYACGTAFPHKGRDHKSAWRNTITALDAASGKILWRSPHRQDGIFTTPDLLVADGLVWHAPIDSGHSTGDYVGLDLRTGKVVRDFKCDKRPQMPHHRCYRNRATDRFIFTGWTGVNIFGCRTGKWDHNFWIRGACRYGVMPANGLLYNTPSVCTCYINSKIKGFNALADHSPSRRLPKVIPEEGRLVRGQGAVISDQSFAKAMADESVIGGEDWATYRGAPDRHGVASTPLSEAYAAGWKHSIGGKLTQPVVSGGSVFVAAYDQHAVYALHVNDGAVKWRFQGGGVVSSPPTIWEGTAIFGCNDGWVYCVSAGSGELVWKYRAAPLDRRMIACENLESVWPVHGSVLVVPDPETGKGKVYTVAGRSIFLDGGLRFLVLDAETGAKIAETVMNEVDPDTGKNVQLGHEWPPDLPAGLPDVLSLSNDTIYMGIQPFSRDGKRRGLYYPKRSVYGVEGRDAKPMTKRPSDEGIHLFSTIGFLDDSEMHRSVWMYGKDSFGGCWGFPVATFAHPSGQILSVMKGSVYGYGRQFYNEGNQQFMHLFATARNPKLVTYEERFRGQKKKDRRGGPHIQSNMATVPRPEWSRTTGTYVRALLAGTNKDAGKSDLLFAVGFPEVIDEHDAMDLIKKQQHRGFKVDKIYQKERSAKGEFGAKLMVVSADNGETLSETKLDAPAVFDGMSAAYGKLFVSDTKGNVLCLKPSEKRGVVDLNLPVIDDSDPVTARGNNPPHQTATEAFDGKIATKWLDFSPEGSWIQYNYKDRPKAVTGYGITSAEDGPMRDPRDWQFLGSNDGGKTWIILDSRTGEMWAKRNEKRSFTVNNKTAYGLYRLNITAVRDVKTANSVQLAEIEFF